MRKRGRWGEENELERGGEKNVGEKKTGERG